ncbi:GEgh16 protein [Xylariaceae sp. FL0804]|nr:GEgh16 protein [Xylariaceae sp. FL0804]
MQLSHTVILSALLAVAHGQGVILSAQGNSDSPASRSFQVDTTDDADANFISDDEIGSNLVNECGRTLLGGNIDAGENTEDALAAQTVTEVTKGSNVDVSVRQVNATGAGPYTCELDETSNTAGLTGRTKLDVDEDDADDNGNINLSVAMPSDMKCIGASTGNVCTVRCRNANNFGGCFAVQQTDVAAHVNTPANIQASQTLKDIKAQIVQNNKDFAAAASGIATAQQDEAEQALAVVNAIQQADQTTDGDVAAAESNTADLSLADRHVDLFDGFARHQRARQSRAWAA